MNITELKSTYENSAQASMEQGIKLADTPSLYLWKSPDGIIRVMQKHNNNYIDLSSPTQDVWETEEIGSNNLIQIENPYERPHRNINDTNVSNGEATLSGGPS